MADVESLRAELKAELIEAIDERFVELIQQLARRFRQATAELEGNDDEHEPPQPVDR